MNDRKWITWKMQTSKTWQDMEDVLKYINIDFIDYDHKILVEYALELNVIIDRLEAEFTLESLEEINKILNKLYEYAKAHFDREEEFMEKYDLPAIADHKQEHNKILNMLRTALDDFALGKVKVNHNLKIQVMDWIVDHINVTDYKYFDLEHWSNNLINASDWSQVKDIIKLTGIREIDNQHKELTERAIELMVMLSKKQTSESIIEGFNSFRDFVIFHFDFEQKFMDKHGMVDVESHLDRHKYFVDRLQVLPKEIIEGITQVEDTKVWILTWWIKHINITDMETFNFKNWAVQAIDEAKEIGDVSYILRRTHIDSIDDDHLFVMKKTLDLYNRLLKVNVGKGERLSKDVKDEVVKDLEEIYKFAGKHFSREEVIMKKYDMPDFIVHSAEHGEILKRLENMVSNFKNDRLYLSKNVKNMILEWWILHTNNVDYRTFVTNLSLVESDRIKKGESTFERLQ